MSDSNKSISVKAGLPPGVLIHIGNKKADKVRISLIDFNLDSYDEKEIINISECQSYKDNNQVSWINVDGLHKVDVIEEVGHIFGLHPLVQEDIVNTKNRPSYDDLENHIFITLKMLGLNEDASGMVSEQVTFILGKDWVLSFQEQEGDIFDTIRKRLREGKGPIRSKGADFLLYRLIDTVVDNYFIVTDHYAERIELLEEEVLSDPNTESLNKIQKLKRELTMLRKMVNPVREIVSGLTKESNTFIKKGTLMYLRDVYDHVIQAIDSIDSQREMLNSIMDLYLSGVSNKMNQVMQVLTIMATIFIPLTFIAGIYGMNFTYMPELQWKYGYFAVWGFMILTLIGMIIYFRRKGWF